MSDGRYGVSDRSFFPCFGHLAETDVTFTRRSNAIDVFFFSVAEVVRAMSYCIQQGWTMYWGTSRWSQVEVRFFAPMSPSSSTRTSFTDYGSLHQLPSIQLHPANCRASRISHVLSREMRIVFAGNVQQNRCWIDGLGSTVDVLGRCSKR